MVQTMTESELTAVVGATDTRTLTNKVVNKLVYGCGCGGNHGLACPAAQ